MNIGELARRSGVAASTIRFYERVGLLQTVERRANGYRAYPPEALLMLHLVVTAQNAGFSLDEIRALLPPDLEHWETEALLAALRRKLADIDVMQARLAQNRADIAALVAEIEAKPDDMDCATNARRLLARILEGHGAGAKMAAGGAKRPDKPRANRSAYGR